MALVAQNTEFFSATVCLSENWEYHFHKKKEINLGIFTGKTDAEVEAPIVWPPGVKSRVTGKDPDVGQD